MENTIENAKEFLTKWRDERTHPVSTDYFAELIVAYANSVRPEVKLPSEHTTQEYVFDFDNGKEYGHNECLSEIKRLNPNVNFVESK